MTVLTISVRLALAVLFIVVGIVVAMDSTNYVIKAMWFPLIIAIGVAIISALVVLRELWLARKAARLVLAGADVASRETDIQGENRELTQGLLWIGLVGVYVAGMYAVGFVPATAGWILLFLLRGAKVSTVSAVITTILATGGIWAIAELFSISLPAPGWM